MGQAGDVVFGGDKGDAESEDAGSDVACLSDAMHPPYNGNSIIYERVCELVFFFYWGFCFRFLFRSLPGAWFRRMLRMGRRG